MNISLLYRIQRNITYRLLTNLKYWILSQNQILHQILKNERENEREREKETNTLNYFVKIENGVIFVFVINMCRHTNSVIQINLRMNF